MKNFLLMVAMLLGMAASAQQTAKSLTASNNVFIGFLEYKPADYNANPNTKYPLIIFLHGIGERGNGTTELQNVASNAIPRYIKDGDKMTYTWNGKTETFLVLSPQLSSNYGWWQPFYVEEMIKYAKQNLRIDTNRIILTGLSLGGGGVWLYAAGNGTQPKNLAAIAPVCGTCQNVSWSNIVNANLPVWGFHANDDGTVPASCTIGAVNAINNLNGPVKAYSTIWPTGQHWIWDRAYDRTHDQQNPNVYEWFLAQNKSLGPNKRPVANAGADISTTTGTGSATLNASGSADSDGSIVRYVWRLVSGPTQVSFPAAYSTSPTTTVSGMSIAGTYQFELKAVDNRADWSTDLVTVTVTSGGSSAPPPPTNNKPVVVKAGADMNVSLPLNNITLDGSGTTDPDGPVKGYEWVKTGGPACTITDPKSAKTTVTNLSAGVYSFKLTAWGDNWVPLSDTVIVTVNAAPVVVNKPPVAIAGSDITNTLPANSATLNGAASYDDDGAIAAYSWSKIGGPAQGIITNATTASATVASLASGTYTYRLQVTDDKGDVSADTMSVVVKSAAVGGNQPVVANAGTDAIIILPVNKAILDGSASSDPDGEPKAYEWKRISGPTSCVFADPKSSVAIASNLVAGTYKFELMVWGDNWVPRADTVTVIVQTPVVTGNIAPIVNAGAPCSVTLPVNTTALNGAATYDIDGSIVSYKWSKISGPAQYTIANDTSVATTLFNLVAGTYQFRLQATDNNNATSDDTVTVQVNAPANSPAVAKAGDDIMISLPANSVNVDGSASFDVDGAIKTYEWIKISGPASYSIGNSRSAKTTISNLEAGTYKFQLMVWGDNWVPRADTMQVTVAEAAPSVVNRSSANFISESMMVPQVKVYPSPATDVINLQYQDGNIGRATAIIYDISGKIVSQMNFTKEQAVYQRSMDISKLQPGVYHMAVISKNKRTLVNFVKQ
jgi:poly(3-hydroxybutyrate) depolymerase